MNVRLTIKIGLLLVLSHASAGFAVTCSEETYLLLTQADVDAFPSECDEVSGDLKIVSGESDPSDIINLRPLANISVVGGSLTISQNSALSNLDGLSNLQTVGSLEIFDNAALEHIDALSAITSAGGVSILLNPSLVNLDGLSGITEVESGFWIGLPPVPPYPFLGNKNLTDISGLENLTRIGGTLVIAFNDSLKDLTGLHNLREANELEIRTNELLTDLSGLSGLKQLSSLRIRGGSLESLNGLQGVQGKLEYLQIGNIEKLKNIDALRGITGVTQNLAIYRTGIKDVDGLTGLGDVGDIEISGNPDLDNLDGLSNVKQVGEIDSFGAGLLLRIADNASLQNIDGLQGYGGYVSSVQLVDNPMLADIDGLSGLSRIRGLRIIGNRSLVNVDGLSGITEFERFTQQEIGDNEKLENLRGLSNVVSVGSLTIRRNDSLINLSGLESLDNARGLYLIENSALESIDQLIRLRGAESLVIKDNGALKEITVGESFFTRTRLVISFNKALEKISGFESLNGLSYLEINDNYYLYDCSVLAPALGWPDGPPDDAVGTELLVANNRAGCNSVAEIVSSYSPSGAPAAPEASPIPRFRTLLDTVKTARGNGRDSDNNIYAEVPRESPSRQLAGAADGSQQNGALAMPHRPVAIPTLPPVMLYLLVFFLVGLAVRYQQTHNRKAIASGCPVGRISRVAPSAKAVRPRVTRTWEIRGCKRSRPVPSATTE